MSNIKASPESAPLNSECSRQEGNELFHLSPTSLHSGIKLLPYLHESSARPNLTLT